MKISPINQYENKDIYKDISRHKHRQLITLWVISPRNIHMYLHTIYVKSPEIHILLTI
jgi:hypothetical protein